MTLLRFSQVSILEDYKLKVLLISLAFLVHEWKNSILGDNSITSSPREEQEINEMESDYLILSFYIRAATNGDPYKHNNQAPCE